MPLVPGGFALTTLIGWVLVEPELAESLPAWIVFIAVPPALIWVRTFLRALLALFPPREESPASTVGVLRPRIALSRRFVRALDQSALHAAHAHVAAHARHNDPRRIWLAQIATDLQWPSPRADRRLTSWLTTLELARDEETRSNGVDGADLAAAILVAHRLRPTRRACAAATLSGEGAALKTRVSRLLTPMADEPRSTPTISARNLFVAALLGIGIVLGVLCGEPLVHALLAGAS